MNILFICSRNLWRSATAETIFKGRGGHHVLSAGTAASARTKVSAKLLLWADLIYVMEHKHKKILQERFRNEIQGKQLEVLDIPDDYQYMDEELVDMLEVMVNID
jgi:predicted protein tyrosine phosphatase